VYYGPLVLRLLAGLVLLYTIRVVCRGRVTMGETLCSLKHHWRFLDPEVLELHELTWDPSQEVSYVRAWIMERKSQVEGSSEDFY
jgi:hypothetical protein